MKTPATATHDSHYYTCLGHLGQLNTDRIISIDQGKYSSDCHILLLLTFLNTNFVNVNISLNTKALKPKYQPRRRAINILNKKSAISSTYAYSINHLWVSLAAEKYLPFGCKI